MLFAGIKVKQRQGNGIKGLLWFVQIYLIIVFVVQMVMTIFHDRITNAVYDDLDIVIKEITHFDFLFKPSFNFLLVLAILILFYCFVQLYKDSIHNKAKVKLQFIELSIFLSFILTLIMSVLQIKDDFIFDYTIRFYPPVIALPCGLFLWWICEQKKVDIEKWGREGKKLFLLSSCIFVLTFVFFRLNFDYSFYKYQMRISKYLHNHKGFMEPYQLEQSLEDIKFDYKLLQFQN